MAKATKVGVDIVGMGKKDGETVLTAIQHGGTVMRDMITQRAEQFYAIADKSKAWLDGYGEIVGKVRKSEASTVFKTFTAGKATEIKAFKGKYSDWITECRKMRDTGTSGNSRVGTKHVTDKGQAKIEERVSTMSQTQAESLIDKALMQLRATAKDQWEKAILVKIEDMAEILKSSKQPFFQGLAEKIQSVGAEYLEQQAISAATAKAEEHKIPQPAIANEQDDDQQKLAA